MAWPNSNIRMVIDDVNNKISPFLWLKAFYQNSHALHPLRHSKLQNFHILLESWRIGGGDGFQVFSDGGNSFENYIF